MTASGITHEMMTVTPTMAIQWLEHKNRHNRPIRQNRVQTYADIIRRGEWEPAVGTISFDVFRRGEPMQQLSWRGGGASPEAFPVPI